MSKNLVDTEGAQMTSQYDAYVLLAGLEGIHELMRMHTPTRPSTHMRARTSTRAHTDQQAILIAFPQLLLSSYLCSFPEFKWPGC
jgi:hypothetical protein